ncbi:hypothetical protein MRB53_036073 [Persea americana]|uniref:Uncharacterized protein n=1 Tax=Persea americana TaxID=3435 RepID=A0ACC2K6V5_PERAE|nr:hypothetical protein MRB53_036073 [Persea americana]
MKKLDGESEDEKVGVEKRIKALQRLVPGGESLDPERLFEETADYILALEEQVNALKVLASFFDGLEKEKTKEKSYECWKHAYGRLFLRML